MFEGEALLRRMYRYGFLDETQTKLDYVLALTPQDVLERRLQVPRGHGKGARQGGTAKRRACTSAGQLLARVAGGSGGSRVARRELAAQLAPRPRRPLKPTARPPSPLHRPSSSSWALPSPSTTPAC